MSQGNRIRDLRKLKKLTQQAIATYVGVSRVAVAKWESGDTKDLKPSHLFKLATLLGQAPESLVSGVASTPALIDLDANDDIRAIRRVRFKLQAGVQGYAIELDDGQGPPIFFRRDWIESRGFRADKLLAVRVAGSSMEPTLYDGDLVVINTDDTSPKDGEPYGVWYEGEPGIKRLRRDQGEWWMYSDNQDQRRYAPRRCNGDTTLIGRVVYRQTERI